MHTIFVIALWLVSTFMILLILIQRGKGGGLAGAFGGMGGQSAFGTKAGDAFTKITVVTAVIWLVLCIGVILYLKNSGERFSGFGSGAQSAPLSTEGAPSDASTSGTTSTPSPAPAPAPTSGTAE